MAHVRFFKRSACWARVLGHCGTLKINRTWATAVSVFLGGSFIKHGGQNPIEPARLGSQIIHGPNVDNFKEIYKLFNNKRISHKVKNIQQFTKIVDKLINTSKRDNNKFIEIKKIGKTILDKSTQEINNIVKNEIKKT